MTTYYCRDTTHDVQLPSEWCPFCEIESLRARLAEAERDAAYLKWRINAIIPLFQEARDALCAIPLASAKLRGLDLTLGDRMDKAGTATRADFDVAMSTASQPHDNNTNVSVQANLASTLTSHPSLSPTHCCVDCGALWRQCDDFSMNLRSASCCDACNNAPVGPQIRPLYVAPTAADREDGSHG